MINPIEEVKMNKLVVMKDGIVIKDYEKVNDNYNKGETIFIYYAVNINQKNEFVTNSK